MRPPSAAGGSPAAPAPPSAPSPTVAAAGPLSSSPTRYDPDPNLLSTSASSRHSSDYLHANPPPLANGPRPRQRGTGSSSSSSGAAAGGDSRRPSLSSTNGAPPLRSNPGSGSAGNSRRSSPSRSAARMPPRRGSSGAEWQRDDEERRPPVPSRYNSADVFAAHGPSANSSSLASVPTQDDAGCAGRGAGSRGGRGMASVVPTINTHMSYSSGGGGGGSGPASGSSNLLSPAAGPSSASPSPGPYSAGSNDSRSSLLPGGRRPSPLQIPSDGTMPPGQPSPRTPTHLLSPSMQKQRSSPSHSHSLPPSSAASDHSSQSHSHSHSLSHSNPLQYTTTGGRSPITASFPRSNSSSSSTHPQASAQSPNAPSAPAQYYAQQPRSPIARSPGGHGLGVSPSDGGHSSVGGSRSRGNSGASTDARDPAERERDREHRRERDRVRRDRDRAGGPALCAKCALPMTGQFVRALGTVYHLDCFRCMVRPFRSLPFTLLGT